MVDLELAVIKKILDTGDFDSFHRAGINKEFFTDPKSAAAYATILSTYHAQETWGSTPSIRQVAVVMPEILAAHPTNESIPVLIRDLRNMFNCRKLNRIQLSLNAYVMNGQAETALEYLRKEILTFEQATQLTRDLTFKDNYQDTIDGYDWVRNKRGMTGIPWPWDLLNQETQGIQAGEYIVFNARPKNMKTWVLCYLAYYAYQFARRRVLFYTREMSPETILRRMVAIAGGVDYGKFVKAQLTEEEELRMLRDLQKAGEIENLLDDRGQRATLRVTDCSDYRTGPTVSSLRRKIEDTKPDIVFIDAIYLMQDERAPKNAAEWLKHTHVSRDVRDLARDLRIPIIVSTQVKREGEKTRGVSTQESAYTDAFGQDGHLIFRLNLEKASNKIVVVVSGSREVNLDGFVINAQPANNFTFDTAEMPDSYKKQLGQPTNNPNNPSSAYGTPEGRPEHKGKKVLAEEMRQATQDPVNIAAPPPSPSPNDKFVNKAAQEALKQIVAPTGKRYKPSFR